jgi:hypothetical protein
MRKHRPRGVAAIEGCIYVEDREKALRFSTDVLGLES